MARSRTRKRHPARRKALARPKRALKASRSRRVSRRAAGISPVGTQRRPPKKVIDPRTAKALKKYARALKYFNQQSYRSAKKILEALVQEPNRELAERARVHLNICQRRLQRPEPPKLKSGDDYYYYGVSMTNLRRFEEARAAFEKARRLLPKADYVYYALASLAALTAESDQAIENLERAIRLRPENRFQARSDPDFQSLETDPRFQDLLYPKRAPGSTPNFREGVRA